LKERFPKSYDSFIDEYHQNIVRGKSEGEIVQNTRANLLPFILELAPLSADDVLVDYARILTDQYAVLNKRNPTACYLYASGTGNPDAFLHMPQDLRDRELAVQERVIRTAIKRPALNRTATEALWEKVRTRVKSGGVTESDLQIMAAGSVDASKHEFYCTVSIALFREITRMPQREAAILMRSVLEK
jgi:hypothetical protein